MFIEIKIKGQLNPKWSAWFGGLKISQTTLNETVLAGLIADQAALYGIISHLRDLGLQLVSVSSKELGEDWHEYSE